MIRSCYCPAPQLSAKALGIVCLVFAAVCLYPLFGSEKGRVLLEQQSLKLLTVNMVYVDPLNGNSGAQQIRDMLIGSLHRTGLFVITEDQEQADAFLRGSAENLAYSDYYRSYEGLRVRGSASSSERDSGESEFQSGSFGVGDIQNSSRRERKHEAVAAIRLVLRSGEVIWSTTKESPGGKYKGSAADVADKVAKDLAAAYQRAEKLARKP